MDVLLTSIYCFDQLLKSSMLDSWERKSRLSFETRNEKVVSLEESQLLVLWSELRHYSPREPPSQSSVQVFVVGAESSVGQWHYTGRSWDFEDIHSHVFNQILLTYKGSWFYRTSEIFAVLSFSGHWEKCLSVLYSQKDFVHSYNKRV